MNFVIDGEQHADACSSFALRVVEILKALPDGDLFTNTGLAKKLECSKHTLVKHSTDAELGEFRFRTKIGKVYYGNPATIKEAKARYGRPAR